MKDKAHTLLSDFVLKENSVHFYSVMFATFFWLLGHSKYNIFVIRRHTGPHADHVDPIINVDVVTNKSKRITYSRIKDGDGYLFVKCAYKTVSSNYRYR